MSTISTILMLCLTASADDAMDALEREEARHRPAVAKTPGEDGTTSVEVAPPDESAPAQRDALRGFVPQATSPASSAKPAAARSGRDLSWRVAAGLGSNHPHADSVKWLGESPRPAAQLHVERRLDPWFDGLSLYAGLAAWSRGSDSHPAALSMLQGEATVGAALEPLPAGLWGLVYPYGRIDFILGYSHVRAGDQLADGLVVPGTSVHAGARVAFGRGTRGRARIFAFAEGGYAYRMPRTVKLTRVDEDDDDPFLSGPAVRLGTLALSGATWRVGLGLAF
jgi:hypothetical protein